MQRCPNCRARLDGGDHCRRCGMALKLLRQTHRAAETRMARAAELLNAGDPAAAAAQLRDALALRRDPMAEWLLAFTESLPEGSERQQAGPGA